MRYGYTIEPEDLLQETWRRAFTSWAEMKRPSDPVAVKNWLKAILKYFCIDHAKKQRTEAERNARVMHGFTGASDPTDARQNVVDNDRSVLKYLFPLLRPRDREFLNTYVKCHGNTAALAYELRTARQDVHMRLHRCKRRIESLVLRLQLPLEFYQHFYREVGKVDHQNIQDALSWIDTTVFVNFVAHDPRTGILDWYTTRLSMETGCPVAETLGINRYYKLDMRVVCGAVVVFGSAQCNGFQDEFVALLPSPCRRGGFSKSLWKGYSEVRYDGWRPPAEGRTFTSTRYYSSNEIRDSFGDPGDLSNWTCHRRGASVSRRH